MHGSGIAVAQHLAELAELDLRLDDAEPEWRMRNEALDRRARDRAEQGPQRAPKRRRQRSQPLPQGGNARIASIACEQLVAAIPGKRDSHVPPRQPADD